MRSSIRAVYENGAFRPVAPVEIAEGTEVEVYMPEPDEWQPPSPQDVNETIRAISELPRNPDVEPDAYASRDHDHYLYGALRRSSMEEGRMVHREFTIILREDEDGYCFALCPEVPEANGQGKTHDECREDICEAVNFVLQVQREDCLRGVPPEALRETVVVE